MGNDKTESNRRLTEAELRKKVEDILITSGLENEILKENAPYFKLMQSCPETRKKFDRNAPCPCGSGLKYKKCCIKYESEKLSKDDLMEKLKEMGYVPN